MIKKKLMLALALVATLITATAEAGFSFGFHKVFTSRPHRSHRPRRHRARRVVHQPVYYAPVVRRCHAPCDYEYYEPVCAPVCAPVIYHEPCYYDCAPVNSISLNFGF